MNRIPPLVLIGSLALGGVAFVAAFAGGLHFSGALEWRPAAAPVESVSASPAPTAERLNRLAKELDDWSRDLSQRKRQLVEMDKNLLQRTALLQAEREALDRERLKLSDLQKQMQARLLTIEKGETANLEQLSDLCSSMKPDEASRLMRQFADDQTTRLLVMMKTTKSAKLLEAWSSQFPDDRERIAKILNRIRTVTKDAEPIASIAPATPPQPEVPH